ncbi:hypothetical protein DND58_27930 [Pseudomonas syringae pv. pisi]|nr:hypothetical protein DND58_27930 [Pseudomonas syringae pv. pisi]
MGVWGSFTTPRSRGQRGRCEMTRAAPLVFKRPNQPHFKRCPAIGPATSINLKSLRIIHYESRHHQLHRHCRQNHHCRQPAIATHGRCPDLRYRVD